MSAKDDSNKMSPAHLHALVACGAVIRGKVMPEGDVREICKAGGYIGVGQNVLLEVLKIDREDFDNSLLARFNSLASVSPDGLLKCFVDILEYNLSQRVHDKYTSDNAVNSELQEANMTANLENTELRNELEKLNDDIDQLRKAHDTANDSINDLLERNRKLELEKTLLEGRLMERDRIGKKKPPTGTKGPAKKPSSPTPTGGPADNTPTK